MQALTDISFHKLDSSVAIAGRIQTPVKRLRRPPNLKCRSRCAHDLAAQPGSGRHRVEDRAVFLDVFV